MLKNSGVKAKIARPVGPKPTEKPIKIDKPLKKHDENKEKSNNTTSSKKTTTVTATKKISSIQSTNAVANARIGSKSDATKSKQATPIAPTIKPKISNATASKVVRQVPMRAIHQVQVKKPVAEKNVMNTVHNVTVASPPSVRKEQTNHQLSKETLPKEREKSIPQLMETLPRERTKTRTLEPEEVLILKESKDSQKPTISAAKIEQIPLIIQEPVAFEITFDKAATSPKIDSSSKPPKDDEDYEDDFDSYESDFETESSVSSQAASTSSQSEDDSGSTGTPTESQSAFTPKKLDENRDFDSGTYELKGVAEKVQLDSIDERELHSEGQNDSGFGYSNATPSPIEQSNSTSFSVPSKHSLQPTYNKRGMELMKKINLDTMSFNLFELKPLSYDLYMKIYGHRNTSQSSSQTMGNMVDQDAQTDNKAKQSMWTQFPPSFVTNVISSENYHNDRIECGEGIDNVNTVQSNDECLFENSLKIINRTNVLRDVRSTKPIDYERLNFFLQKSAITVSTICDASVAMHGFQKSDSSFSDGFFRISINESKIFDDTTVYYMYSNPLIDNIVYLAHRQSSTSRRHDNSLVSLWNILDTNKPINVLSCWSLIICLEVHHHFQDVVIGGLTDGCVAVWNINESLFWHKNNNQETLPPTQIVSPSIDTKSICFDFGCITSLKSLHRINKNNDDDFKLTQFCSLHEFGMLTIWTIVKTNSHSTNSESSNERKIDHRSPWSKIQIIQSNYIDLALASINLNKKVRPKSGFEKKKMYFESNLFSDAALRELHNFDAQKYLSDQSQSIRCVDMEYHDDGVVIATNKSFLIFVATSLNKNSLRKILIDETNLLHATKLKSLDEVLLVGLTDGSVKVIRAKPSTSTSSDKDRKDITPGVPFEQNNFSAKSCAIQNIIKERKFSDDGIANRFKQIEKVTSDTTTVRGNRLINNQILLPATSSNRDFVRWMDLSVNLHCMMSLCGERLRMVNFQSIVEVRRGESDGEIGLAAMVSGYNHREYMVILEEDSVRVHILRKKIL